MVPTSLTVTNFFGFAHETLDLSTIGVGVIVGRNGSGKSSIFDAIRFALYGRCRLQGDAIIRRGAAFAKVALDFEARGSKWRVSRERVRDKTGTLRLEQRRGDEWANATRHTIAETQVEIERLVGLSYAAFLAGPVMVQEEPRGDLMALDPKARKDLIIEEAEVAGYEPLHDAAKEALQMAEVAIRVNQQRIEILDRVIANKAAAEAALSDIETRLAAAVVERDGANDAVTAAKVGLAEAEAQAAADVALAAREANVRAQRKSLAADVDRHIATLARLRDQSAEHVDPPGPFDQAALDSQRTLVETLRGKARQKGALVIERVALRHDISRIEQGVPDVPCHAEGIYATCPLLAPFAISDEERVATRARWDDLNVQLAVLDTDLNGEQDAELAYNRMTAEAERHRIATERYRVSAQLRDTLATGIAEAEANRNRSTEALAAADADLQAIEAERATTSRARAAAMTARDAVADAQRAARTAQAALRSMEDLAARARAVVVEVQQAEADRPLIAAELAERHVARDTYTVLAAAFHRDGVPSMVIEALLPVIEARANEALAKMPEDMSLRLAMGAVTKSGSISDRLDVTVLHEGAETPYAALSGAQQFRVNLALRLGQQRVLAARAGTSVEFLLLDEADRDLDEAGVDALVETITAIADWFRLILLISHHSWLIDRVPTRIDLARRAGLSTFTVT